MEEKRNNEKNDKDNNFDQSERKTLENQEIKEIQLRHLDYESNNVINDKKVNKDIIILDDEVNNVVIKPKKIESELVMIDLDVKG